MNGKQAKKLRRQAMCRIYNWYRSLLPEEQQPELSMEMAVEYTPKLQYWTQYHERVHPVHGPYTSQQIRVSDNTHRWFYLQEKKKYASR